MQICLDTLLRSNDPQIKSHIDVDEPNLRLALEGQNRMNKFFKRMLPLLAGRLHTILVDEVESKLDYKVESLSEVVPQVGNNEFITIGFPKQDAEDVGVRSLLTGILGGLGYKVRISFEEAVPTSPEDGYHNVPLLNAKTVGYVKKPDDSLTLDDDIKGKLFNLGGKIRKANGVLRDTPWAVRYFGQVTERLTPVLWNESQSTHLADILEAPIQRLQDQGKTDWVNLFQSAIER